MSISFSQLIHVTCWTKCVPVCPARCGCAAPVSAPSGIVSNGFPPNKHPATLTFRLPSVSAPLRLYPCQFVPIVSHVTAYGSNRGSEFNHWGPQSPRPSPGTAHTHQNPYWQCGAVGRMLMVPCSVYRLLQRSCSSLCQTGGITVPGQSAALTHFSGGIRGTPHVLPTAPFCLLAGWHGQTGRIV